MGRVHPWQQAIHHVAALTEAAGGGPPLPASARVVVHLHPDRVVAATGLPALEAIAAAGRYRSQFETGTSAGGLTAHPGGDRWRWESDLFEGAYDAAPAAERPVHGRARPGHAGLPGQRAQPGGARDGSVGARPGRGSRRAGGEEVRRARRLRGAHVHGQLLLACDVEAVVLDPCFRGTAVEVAAERIRTTTGAALEWTPGCTVGAADLAGRPECVAYRGADVVRVAQEVAAALTDDGVLDAAVVGRAVALGRWDAQHLKRVWHCVARFGSSASRS